MIEEERYLREMIASIERSYRRAVQPYIDALVRIESMKQPAPFVVELTQGQVNKIALVIQRRVAP